MTDKTAPVLELTVDLDATAEQVWQALTDPQRLQNWFPLKSGGDAKPGGKVLLSWGEGVEWETHITRFEPGRHLQWMDVLPDADKPEAILPVVDWYVETSGGRTRLRLVQSGFDPDSDWQEYYDALRRGWTYFLDMLGTYLEYHFDSSRQMVYRRARSLVSRRELWTGLLSALGLGMTAIEGLERVGEAMPLNLSLGEQNLAAEVRFSEAPHAFAVTLPDLNQASLFIELEPGDDKPSCGVWLSTFDLEDGKLRQLENNLDQLCQGLIDIGLDSGNQP